MEDGAVYGGDVGGGYYEEVVLDVACGVGALVEGDLSGGGEVEDFWAGLGGYDGDLAVGGGTRSWTRRGGLRL